MSILRCFEAHGEERLWGCRECAPRQGRDAADVEPAAVDALGEKKEMNLCLS